MQKMHRYCSTLSSVELMVHLVSISWKIISLILKAGFEIRDSTLPIAILLWHPINQRLLRFQCQSNSHPVYHRHQYNSQQWDIQCQPLLIIHLTHSILFGSYQYQSTKWLLSDTTSRMCLFILTTTHLESLDSIGAVSVTRRSSLFYNQSFAIGYEGRGHIICLIIGCSFARCIPSKQQSTSVCFAYYRFIVGGCMCACGGRGWKMREKNQQSTRMIVFADLHFYTWPAMIKGTQYVDCDASDAACVFALGFHESHAPRDGRCELEW